MTAARLISDVAAAANGRWPELLVTIGIDTPPRGKHGPCPVCGGKDRFRFDNKGGRGTWICNRCGAGDGLDLVGKVSGKPNKEAAELLAPLVGLSAGGLDPTERERIHQQQQARAEADAKRTEQQRQKAASRAAAIMRDCEPGQATYLTHKRLRWPSGALNRHVIAVGALTFPTGSLVVPLTDEAGELVNVQLIDDRGSKSYLAGGRKAGAFHRIEGGELVAVVEGFATGLSVHLATGATVYCAMDAGNLLAVARIARRQHPNARILLCGDNDVTIEGNPGKTKAEHAAAAVGALVVLPPEFSGDWNDYHQAHGLTATKKAIQISLVAQTPQFLRDWNDHHQAQGLTKTGQESMIQVNSTEGQSTISSTSHPSTAQRATDMEGAKSLSDWQTLGSIALACNPNPASQREGAEVVPLRPQTQAEAAQSATLMIDKMSASQRAALLVERLGEVAINDESERVYRYNGSLWEQLSDTELRRQMAVIFTEHGAPFSDKGIAAAVSTMKLIIPLMGQPSPTLIGFANGVYDMTTRRFRPHSPADGLLNHNGICYSEPQPGETAEHSAPHFTKWLRHAADSDSTKMDRIRAALFMVLANRHDWQLFLEVTGEGGSGKSVFAHIATLLAGGPRNTGSGNMAALDNARGRAQFVDKRLILLPDQPKYIGDGSGIKAITGGDLVEIDGKYEKQFSAVIRAVVLATNNEPMVITERYGGVSRRRVIFTFDRVVAEADKDPAIGDKIAAELPVMIRHLLTQFAEPEQARRLLLEQRSSADALTIKRATDPVIDLCAALTFLDGPSGLYMGGNSSVKREPRRYLYHLYLAYMDYHGLGRPLSVQKFSHAVKSAAKEYGMEYRTRKVKGYTQTNAEPTDSAGVFMPQTVHVETN